MHPELSPPQLPPHLAGTRAAGVVPGQPVAQFEIGSMRNFVYLVIDWRAREAAIVDPQSDLSAPFDALRAHGLRLSDVLLTHTHHDHVAGVPFLAESHPQIPIHVHPADLHRIRSRLGGGARIQELRDGGSVKVGGLAISVLHTPGHSAGECCFYLEAGENPPRPYLLTGDTVFIRDCGRTDLETGSNEEMFRSLQRIKALPPETILLPGHHYARECATTISRELAESAPFRCRSVEELASLP